MDGDYLGGVGDKAVGQLGDMHQSVLLNADIDEATKVRDVRDDAGEHHPLAQVVQRFDRRVEGKDLYALLRGEPEARRYFDSLPSYAREQIQTRPDGVNSLASLKDYADNLLRGDD